MSEPVGRVVAVCVSAGGIPKQPIQGNALVSELGIEGDGHHQDYHGGPTRAVCILSTEDYLTLEADGVPTDGPGTFGENLLIDGFDFSLIRPDQRFAVGDEVVLVIDDVRAPCTTLKSIDPRFPDLMLGRSGFMCRVERGGRIEAGQAFGAA